MRRTLKIVGIIMILTIVVTVASLALAAPRAVGSPIRVAVYISTGANSDKIIINLGRPRSV